MKTIEEQAREYACDGIHPDSMECKSCYNIYGKCNYEAFIAGAKAATRWIPVEEEPDDKDRLLLALTHRGDVHTSFWGGMAGHNRIIKNDRRDQTFKYYTHWLPIPPMPEK